MGMNYKTIPGNHILLTEWLNTKLFFDKCKRQSLIIAQLLENDKYYPLIDKLVPIWIDNDNEYLK